MKILNQWLTLLTNIGVLVGIGLLIYELNQNTALTRAEIHAMRAEAKTERQMFLANGGDIASIAAKLFDAGYPRDSGAMSRLSAEEAFRFRIFIEGFKEAVANWHFQCQQGLLDEELCETGYRQEVRSLIVQANATGVDLTNLRPSFVADVRRIASESNLPVPSEDGSWPE